MSLYAERAYFDGDHCQHVAALDEHRRLTRLQRQMTRNHEHPFAAFAEARDAARMGKVG